jgi:hypothetical protein
MSNRANMMKNVLKRQKDLKLANNDKLGQNNAYNFSDNIEDQRVPYSNRTYGADDESEFSDRFKIYQPNEKNFNNIRDFKGDRNYAEPQHSHNNSLKQDSQHSKYDRYKK